MTALIAGSAVRTCFGDGDATFEALLRGRTGVADLEGFDGPALGVLRGYPAPGGETDDPRFRASRLLATCVREALEAAAIGDPGRLVVLVGTGLRELVEVERWSAGEGELAAEQLHFSAAVREAVPAAEDVVTLSNACSASGHALALAQDLVELGDADTVVAAGADTMTASMLAMIGRVANEPADQLRPFDAARGGALLGDGAAAMVVVPEDRHEHPRARLLATGLSCDAHHETAAHGDGIGRAIGDAFARAQRAPEDVDLVIAHGTGTTLNDPLESELLHATFGRAPRGPVITAVKGAIGHTSGAAALMSVDVAMRCLREGVVPPIAGLDQRIPEAAGLTLVESHWAPARMSVAQVNAFGFGGVNAVTLLEAVT